eukprot:GHRR01016942.1.p1 GENE.GHRR01016942.1~~GHRR01016942.1.p1  ORF type:complete len:162 (+),score=9.55 GHRR01016942.1:396-881(+)
MSAVNAWGWGARTLLLLLIATMSFSIRLFSVVKYESVIHEFDPYFNYRVTQFLTKNGFYNLWDWFDDRTWYPLGRVIGGTVYPGLIYTAGAMCNILHFFNIPVHVQEVCSSDFPLPSQNVFVLIELTASCRCIWTWCVLELGFVNHAEQYTKLVVWLIMYA